MKSQKGIALTSLIIYVIAMLIVISIISVISTFFYNNIEEVGENVDPSKEFTQFNTYFLQDINRDEIEVIECKNINPFAGRRECGECEKYRVLGNEYRTG